MATERDSHWRIQRTVFFLGGGELWRRGPNRVPDEKSNDKR